MVRPRCAIRARRSRSCCLCYMIRCVFYLCLLMVSSFSLYALLSRLSTPTLHVFSLLFLSTNTCRVSQPCLVAFPLPFCLFRVLTDTFPILKLFSRFCSCHLSISHFHPSTQFYFLFHNSHRTFSSFFPAFGLGHLRFHESFICYLSILSFT